MFFVMFCQVFVVMLLFFVKLFLFLFMEPMM